MTPAKESEVQMDYKGYSARVVFDEDAGVLFGEVDGLRDVVTFEATNTKHLAVAFRESVDDYLAMCAKRHEEPERPYSGKFLVRTDPGVHRDLARAAARAGKSLNSYTSEALQGWLVREGSATYPQQSKTSTTRRLGKASKRS